MEHLVLIVVVLPIAGSLVLALLPRAWRGLLPGLALSLAAVQLGMTAWLFTAQWRGWGTWLHAVPINWLPQLRAEMTLTADGPGSAFMVAAAVVTLGALAAGGGTGCDQRRTAVCALALNGTATGLFAAADLLSFLVFFEIAALPAYALVRGDGTGERDHAARRLAIHSAVGGGVLLLAVVTMAASHRHVTGSPSYAMAALLVPAPASGGLLSVALAGVFLLRSGVVPGHVALAAAARGLQRNESALFLGLWLPAGTYGLVRVWAPLNPLTDLRLDTWLTVLGSCGLVYSGLLALADRESSQRVVRLGSGLGSLVLLGAAHASGDAWLGAALLALCLGPGCCAVALLGGVRGGPECCAAATTHPEVRDGAVGAVTRLAWLLAAGLPTSGTFVALLLLLPALTPRHPWLAVVTGLATAALILAALRWEPPGAGLPVPDGRRSWRLLAGAASPLALLLFIGIYPAPVLDVLRAIRSLEAHRVSGSSSDSSSGVPDADSLSTAAADTTAAGRREVDGL